MEGHTCLGHTPAALLASHAVDLSLIHSIASTSLETSISSIEPFAQVKRTYQPD
jgi:hypothetical protein